MKDNTPLAMLMILFLAAILLTMDGNLRHKIDLMQEQITELQKRLDPDRREE